LGGFFPLGTASETNGEQAGGEQGAQRKGASVHGVGFTLLFVVFTITTRMGF
jgi:hypothetical protein